MKNIIFSNLKHILSFQPGLTLCISMTSGVSFFFHEKHHFLPLEIHLSSFQNFTYGLK